jgi:hypothetical protein
MRLIKFNTRRLVENIILTQQHKFFVPSSNNYNKTMNEKLMDKIKKFLLRHSIEFWKVSNSKLAYISFNYNHLIWTLVTCSIQEMNNDHNCRNKDRAGSGYITNNSMMET